MANRFQTPRPQFFINPVTGLPLNGGKLYFYASGTVTPLSTYTNSTLTIANTNPVVLLSTGYAATDIFLQNLAYTVVLTDSAGVTLWSADNVYTSDFSTVAMFTSYNGNPNGNVAGTAGSSTLSASVIWDYQNAILYVCTTTGSAAAAVWTAVNPGATVATNLAIIQGYLTPISGTAIITADSIAATTVYYTPYRGAGVAIYNGTSLSNNVFSELSLTLLAAAHLASTIYDVFIFNNAGVLTLVTGPAWTNSGAGTGARGVGAGTTQISRGTGTGIWTNTNTMTGTNGATSYAAIAAGTATYLGSIFIDSVAGQVTCHRLYGQSRKWGIWNAYNRAPIYLKGGDATATWTLVANTAIRSSNAAAANSLTVFQGLPEEIYDLRFKQSINSLNSLTTIGIGVNSVAAFSGLTGQMNGNNIVGAAFVTPNIVAEHLSAPILGISTISALERVTGFLGGNIVFQGTNAAMQLSAQYMG